MSVKQMAKNRRFQSILKTRSESDLREGLHQRQSLTGGRNTINRSASLSNLRNEKLTDEMRNHIAKLKKELRNESNLVKQVKWEKVSDVNAVRNEEAKKYSELLKEQESKIKKDHQRQLEKERENNATYFDRETKRMCQLFEQQIQSERSTWYREKEHLLIHIEKAKQDAEIAATENSEKSKKKLQQQIVISEGQRKKLEEELKTFKEINRNHVMENKKIFEEHQNELEKMKRASISESRKQLSEIKQLQRVIEQLEKKLGFEAGTCLRLQMEKYALDDALSRLKEAESWSKRSTMTAKGVDHDGVEFDIEGLIMEMPPRLASKPHNDPERILHRKYVEVCSLVRRLDERNQQLAAKIEDMEQDYVQAREAVLPLEEKVVRLGNKNMELSQMIRKSENKIKDMQKEINTKEEKIVHLQELVERKEKKLKKNKKKENEVNMEEFEDLQKQLCEQLQIIAELRQETIEKDRRIDVLKKRALVEKKLSHDLKRKSISLDSLDHDGTDVADSDDEKILYADYQTVLDENNQNKRRLAKLSKEHMELQKLYSMVQRQCCETKDPQRVELQREALQSDLLVLQATVTELEKQLDEKQQHEKQIEDGNFIEDSRVISTGTNLQQEEIANHVATVTSAERTHFNELVESLTEENKDLQMKLVSAESELVQKTIQLKSMTEDMKEILDQNDLLEFQMTELQNDKKQPSKGLRLSDADIENISTEIDDVSCDAISVRIALKELEINNQQHLNSSEKKTLIQARALVDKGTQEINSLHDENHILSTRFQNIESKYQESRQKLAAQNKELIKLRREKMVREERRLMSVDNGSLNGKSRRRSSVELGFPFGKTPNELLHEARERIFELERSNEILQHRLNREDGRKFDLSQKEIDLLQMKIDQLRDAEKQITMLKVANDNLIRRLRMFERGEGYNCTKNSGKDIKISDQMAEEIAKLKKENEELNKELGTLRRRADDALLLAQKTKEVLNKDDRATQTPSFELADFIKYPVGQQPIQVHTSSQTKHSTPDPEMVQRAMIKEIESQQVVKNIYEQPTSGNASSPNLTLLSKESVDVGRLSTGHPSPNEEQLESDNEFIQSILREYENKKSKVKDQEDNDSVIFRPPVNERIYTSPSLSSSQSHKPFDVYLKESPSPMISSKESKESSPMISSKESKESSPRTPSRKETLSDRSHHSKSSRGTQASSGKTSSGDGMTSPEGIDVHDGFIESRVHDSGYRMTANKIDNKYNTDLVNHYMLTANGKNFVSKDSAKSSRQSSSHGTKNPFLVDEREQYLSQKTNQQCLTANFNGQFRIDSPNQRPYSTSSNRSYEEVFGDTSKKESDEPEIRYSPTNPFLETPDQTADTISIADTEVKDLLDYAKKLRQSSSSSMVVTSINSSLEGRRIYSSPVFHKDYIPAAISSQTTQTVSLSNSQVNQKSADITKGTNDILNTEHLRSYSYFSSPFESCPSQTFNNDLFQSGESTRIDTHVDRKFSEFCKIRDSVSAQEKYMHKEAIMETDILKHRDPFRLGYCTMHVDDHKKMEKHHYRSEKDSGIGSSSKDAIILQKQSSSQPTSKVKNYGTTKVQDSIRTGKEDYKFEYVHCSCNVEQPRAASSLAYRESEQLATSDSLRDLSSTPKSFFLSFEDTGDDKEEHVNDDPLNSSEIKVIPLKLQPVESNNFKDYFESTLGKQRCSSVGPFETTKSKISKDHFSENIKRSSSLPTPGEEFIQNVEIAERRLPQTSHAVTATGREVGTVATQTTRERAAVVEKCDKSISTRFSRRTTRGYQSLPQPNRRSFSHSPTPVSRRKRARSPSPIRTCPLHFSHRGHSSLKYSKIKFSSDTELGRKSKDFCCNKIYTQKFDSQLRILPTPEGNKDPVQNLLLPRNPAYAGKREQLDHLISEADFRLNESAAYNEYLDRYFPQEFSNPRKEILYLREKCESLERQLMSRDEILHNMQHELKEEVEHIALLEKKDKEIHLKAESISHITQILQKTKKELEIKISECNRRESECKQLKQELKCVLSDKKKLEHSHAEQQITISKLESVETKLQQLTSKYDEVVCHNKELLERIRTLEISEKEFIDLERNVIDLQVQLRDMEDIELHRDELFQKLQYVKKQRDDFLEKGKLVEEERNEFVRSNKTLEQYLAEWKRKTIEFKKTNQALKDRINHLEKDKKTLEERIIALQEERVVMQTNLNKLELERDDYIRELREVTAERQSLEHRVADLEDTLSDYDQLEEGFHCLRLKVAELTRQRDDAELLIPSYKAKVQVLKKAIREKEETIMHLSHDLKTLRIAIENSTIDDLGKLHSLQYMSDGSSHHTHYSKPMKNYFHERGSSAVDSDARVPYIPSDFDFSTESESYDQVVVRPHHGNTTTYIAHTDHPKKRKGKRCVVLFDYDPYRSSTSDHPERELKLREGDYITVFGEMDVDGYLEAEVDGELGHRSLRGLVPSIYVEELSEDGSIDYRRDHHHHQHSSSHHQSSGSHSDNVRKFVALYDYDPYTMGTTDRPDRQLSLRKGDVVTVFGHVDVDGYYDAIRNGRRGLIPSNFVEEYSSSSNHQHSSRHQQHSSSYQQQSSSYQQQSSSDNHHHSSDAKDFEGTIEVEEVPGPPYAPRDLKVIRVVTRNAVLLGWDLPSMDEYGKSNGCRVTGYRIWVNGKRKQDCNSPSMTKALVDDVDLHGRVEFSIQSVGDNGFCSEKCHFAITGALSMLKKDCDFDGASDTYVALYDYNPFKSSPNPNPSLELEFQEGDLIKVYDTSRQDGFYSAELNGKRGLVPSNFIERLGRSTHHHSSSESDSNSRRVQFQKN